MSDPPKDRVEPAPLAPVLGRAERFRGRPEALPAEQETDPEAVPEDLERRAAVGGFLSDLAHTLAARGDTEVAALLERSQHERRQALRDRPELHTLEAAAQLLARCRAAWPTDPKAAIEAARLANRLLSDPGRDLAPTPDDRAALLAFSRDHLAAAERIARRAEEIGLRRAPQPQRSETPASDAYPIGAPVSSPLSEVAEDALAVEVEAALDDLRDASLDRGRPYDAALSVLDRARLALDRGGPESLAKVARGESERFLDPGLPSIPREVLRRLAAEAERGSIDLNLLDHLTRALLAAGVGFGS